MKILYKIYVLKITNTAVMSNFDVMFYKFHVWGILSNMNNYMFLGYCGGKVRVKLSLCLTKHHTMETQWGSGGIAPCILNLGTR
jgi:hypothetical protein